MADSMTLSQYLGRGATSRGTLGIAGNLDMQVTKVPYLHTDGDVQAVIQGIDNIRKALKNDPKITMIDPPDNQTTADYVAAVSPPCIAVRP